MRIKIFLLAVLSVCITVIVKAQQVKKNANKPPTQQKSTGPLKLENALLWEISGNTLPQPSYLSEQCILYVLMMPY
jgi:hypothetical protein